jgi:hypothetical protein
LGRVPAGRRLREFFKKCSEVFSIYHIHRT